MPNISSFPHQTDKKSGAFITNIFLTDKGLTDDNHNLNLSNTEQARVRVISVQIEPKCKSR